MIKKVCEICFNNFSVFPYRQFTARFCSRKCSHKWKIMICPLNQRHGHSRNGMKTKTYRTWTLMKARCRRKKDDHYKNYGGRGITVCNRWNIFENFLADMGEKPEGKTIDRINNNGNYEPENCRWATPSEQLNNTRRNHFITFNKKTMTISQWAKDLQISKITLLSRINNKWSIKETITTPINTKFRRKV